MLSDPKTIAWARDHLPKMTALLEEVVRINSHTANKPGVDAVGARFTRHAFGGEFECAEGAQASDFLLPNHTLFRKFSILTY